MKVRKRACKKILKLEYFSGLQGTYSIIREVGVACRTGSEADI